MGWVQLPPTFSTMSETMADVANANFQVDPKGATPLSHHRLDQQASSMDQIHSLPVPEAREPEDHEATDHLCHLVGLNPSDVPCDMTTKCPPLSNQPAQ